MTKTVISIDDSVVDDQFFNVIMYNDDVTPFEYVILVLSMLFNYAPSEGLKIAMHIHENEKAIIATLPMKEAYEKVNAVDALNEEFGFLLQTDVEKA
jgi:ATP-dependent Clp protease adaptor protein ClpS